MKISEEISKQISDYLKIDFTEDLSLLDDLGFTKWDVMDSSGYYEPHEFMNIAVIDNGRFEKEFGKWIVVTINITVFNNGFPTQYTATIDTENKSIQIPKDDYAFYKTLKELIEQITK